MPHALELLLRFELFQVGIHLHGRLELRVCFAAGCAAEAEAAGDPYAPAEIAHEWVREDFAPKAAVLETGELLTGWVRFDALGGGLLYT